MSNTALWHGHVPYTKTNIDKVEKVQRRATKFILQTVDNYETRLKRLNFMSLKNRRFLVDVTFFYKALNGISISILILMLIFILMLIITHLGKMMIYLLRRNNVRTNPFKYSFFNRIADSWNLLPYDTCM